MISMGWLALASAALIVVSILTIFVRDAIASLCGVPEWLVGLAALHLAGGFFAILAFAALSLVSSQARSD